MIIWIRNRKGWVGGIFFGLAVDLRHLVHHRRRRHGQPGVPVGHHRQRRRPATGTSPTSNGGVGELLKRVKAKPKNAVGLAASGGRIRSAQQNPARRGGGLGARRELKPARHGQPASASRSRRRRSRPTVERRRSAAAAGLTSSPGNDSDVLGRHARLALRGLGHAGPGGVGVGPAGEAAQGSRQGGQEGERLVEALDGHVREARRSCRRSRRTTSRRRSGSITARRRRLERRKSGDRRLRGVPQARAGRRRTRRRCKHAREAAQEVRGRHVDDHDDSVIDIETTPGGAARRECERDARLRRRGRSGRGAGERVACARRNHIVIELAEPGSMDESAVGVLVRAARDTRQRGGKLTLCGADARCATRWSASESARLVHLRRRRDERAGGGPRRLTAARWYSPAPGPIAQLVEQGNLIPRS